jgi:hypothetical protein
MVHELSLLQQRVTKMLYEAGVVTGDGDFVTSNDVWASVAEDETVVAGFDLVAPELQTVLKEGVVGWKLHSVRTEWPFIRTRDRKRKIMLIEATYRRRRSNLSDEPFPFRIRKGAQLVQAAKSKGRIWALYMDGLGDFGWAYFFFKPSKKFTTTVLTALEVQHGN